MDRRSRALHRFLVASPILLLVAVGLVGHIRKTPHVGAAGDAAYDQRVLAYRDVVTQSRKLKSDPSIDRRSDLDLVANAWVTGFHSGELQSLTPAAYEDHLRDGVRGEVLRIGLGVAAEVATEATVLHQRGLFSDSANEAMLSAEAAFGLRGFELQAHLQSFLLTRRAISTLEQSWPKLSAEQRQTLIPRLKAMITTSGELEKMANLEASQIRDYMSRQRLSADELEKSSTSIEYGAKQQVATANRGLTILNKRLQSLIDKP